MLFFKVPLLQSPKKCHNQVRKEKPLPL